MVRAARLLDGVGSCQRSIMAYFPLTMVSRTGSSGAINLLRLELTRPMCNRNLVQSFSPNVFPRILMSPLVGDLYPINADSREVLPHPLGPRITQCSPDSTRQFKLSKIRVSPRCKQRSRISRMGFLATWAFNCGLSRGQAKLCLRGYEWKLRIFSSYAYEEMYSTIGWVITGKF